MNKKLNKLNDRPELEKSDIVKGMPQVCSDETAAVEFFEAQRWGDSPCCPHCQSKEVATLKDRDGNRHKRYLWFCRSCAKQFTVRIGTVYEETRLPLRHWAYAFWRASTSKKGVSALEIQRQCQISYKSALFLMHRVRFAMKENDNDDTKKLGGQDNAPVEIDETYVGGKPSQELRANLIKAKGYRKNSNKVPVVAVLERGGSVRTKVVARVNHNNLKPFLQENIAHGSVVNTDQHHVYTSIVYPLVRWNGQHNIVNHAMREYARKAVGGSVAHVNTCESFFSLLKRGIMGTFHNVSREHLHRYCDEFSFRWNTRRMNDGERVVAAIKNAEGKRLLYSDAVAR
jgi:transposase-like protein